MLHVLTVCKLAANYPYFFWIEVLFVAKSHTTLLCAFV